MNNVRFKYQEQIEELLAGGCQLPELFAPNNLRACRFAFSEEGHTNNVPQYMSNPKQVRPVTVTSIFTNTRLVT